MMDALTAAKRALACPGALLIVDVDGTLADDVVRRHLRPVPEPHCLGAVPPEQIERYMAPELVALDRCVTGSRLFLLSLILGAGRARPNVTVITARWDTLRDITAAWLELHFAFLRPQGLLMRPRGDVRPSIEVKLELALRCGKGGVWLDDDPEMLAVAERHGFVPLKAPEVYGRVEVPG
ncbi:hypothetical protein WMF31_00770 [Sorangium sp. So ce1036]|uniref:hypothetical protein n=1 Tax=Sorangium sp. So ce1036 TaxID=3133328 RepID=UPI003F118AE5